MLDSRIPSLSVICRWFINISMTVQLSARPTVLQHPSRQLLSTFSEMSPSNKLCSDTNYKAREVRELALPADSVNWEIIQEPVHLLRITLDQVLKIRTINYLETLINCLRCQSSRMWLLALTLIMVKDLPITLELILREVTRNLIHLLATRNEKLKLYRKSKNRKFT